jgi:DNA-binding GntR family transcriptional regulator
MKKLWMQNHAAFHTALVSACDNRRMVALHAQLYEQSERYRGLMFHVEPLPRDVDTEHHKMVELALARDVKGLIDAMVDHMQLTTKLIVQAFGHTEVAAAALLSSEG